MTTVFLIEKTCYVCGEKNRFPESGPAFSMDSSRDLDGRPSHMGRSNIYMSIQRCIHCGYCAPDVASGHASFCDVVKSSDYASQLNSADFPETANAFLCYTLLLENKGDWAEAGWCALHAAWICDDNSFKEGARSCRAKSYQFFLKTRQNRLTFADSHAEEEILLIDLLRRLERFDEAAEKCEKELDGCEDEAVQCILNYEQHLIDKKDNRCRTSAHAEEFEDSQQQ
ncbi:MAG: hypothetical protein ACLFVQ_08005 [Chitinispirillaceae bacterium]